jgi:hypothetical protein
VAAVDTSDVLAGFTCPTRAAPIRRRGHLDGQGAGAPGSVVQGVTVTGVETERGRVTAVNTDQGRIETEVVVNAAGMWAANSASATACASHCRPPSTTT